MVAAEGLCARAELRRDAQGMYDYAIDKYVPVKFFDYVNQKWSETQARRRRSKFRKGSLLPRPV